MSTDPNSEKATRTIPVHINLHLYGNTARQDLEDLPARIEKLKKIGGIQEIAVSVDLGQ